MTNSLRTTNMTMQSAQGDSAYVIHRSHPYRFVADTGWTMDSKRARRFTLVGDAIFALLTIGRPGDCVIPVLPDGSIASPVWVMFDPADS